MPHYNKATMEYAQPSAQMHSLANAKAKNHACIPVPKFKTMPGTAVPEQP